jgi:hypothetical protein
MKTNCTIPNNCYELKKLIQENKRLKIAIEEAINGEFPCGKCYDNGNCHENCEDAVTENGENCMYVILKRATGGIKNGR